MVVAAAAVEVVAVVLVVFKTTRRKLLKPNCNENIEIFGSHTFLARRC